MGEEGALPGSGRGSGRGLEGGISHRYEMVGGLRRGEGGGATQDGPHVSFGVASRVSGLCFGLVEKTSCLRSHIHTQVHVIGQNVQHVLQYVLQQNCNR